MGLRVDLVVNEVQMALFCLSWSSQPFCHTLDINIHDLLFNKLYPKWPIIRLVHTYDVCEWKLRSNDRSFTVPLIYFLLHLAKFLPANGQTDSGTQRGL